MLIRRNYLQKMLVVDRILETLTLPGFSTIIPLYKN